MQKVNHEEYQKECEVKFSKMTDGEVVDAFNQQVGNTGWTTSRGIYLSSLHQEFKNRNFDFSAIGTNDSLNFKNKVRLDGKKIKIGNEGEFVFMPTYKKKK